MAKFKPLLLLLLGLLIGAGGMMAYSRFVPRDNLEIRTLMARFVLPVPVATCKQIMVLGFRVAGFQTITPDPGEDVGVGAPGEKVSGAALCMPAFGVATLAISGADQALVLDRIQAFTAAVATTNFAPQAPPPRR